MSLVEPLFWLAVGLLAYTYVGYPALIAAWAGFRRRGVVRARIEPPVSVVIVAYDEESRIAARIENILALDYPRERMEIVVVSDGSTDATVARARPFAVAGVTVIGFPHRRGKAAVLADARQRFEPGALRALVAPFADSAVGGVSGELMLSAAGAAGAAAGVGFYWRYEKFIRRHESRLDSTLGVTGAIYAVRRRLFTAIPADTLLDDVLIPARIYRQGYRVIFAPAARAWDRCTVGTDEFRRKVRTIAGNFQLFARERWLLDPRANRLWLQTVSHKGLRLVSPLFLVIAFVANAMLLDHQGYVVTLAAQAAFYAAAVAGAAAEKTGRRVGVLAFPYVFCLLSMATVVAFLRVVRGRQLVTWEKAPAPASATTVVEDRVA